MDLNLNSMCNEMLNLIYGASNHNNNNKKTNGCSSEFTIALIVTIPLIFATIYAGASLCGRVRRTPSPSNSIAQLEDAIGPENDRIRSLSSEEEGKKNAAHHCLARFEVPLGPKPQSIEAVVDHSGRLRQLFAEEQRRKNAAQNQ